MTEPDLTALRSAVANLDQAEKLALATYLTGTSNPKFQELVIPDFDKLTGQLAEACELSAIFPTATRIFFAIELLELQINRDEFEEDEGDGLPDPSDYEGEEYYSSGKPILPIPFYEEKEQEEGSYPDYYGVNIPEEWN